MDKALGMQNPMADNVVLLVSRLLLAWIFVHEGVFLAANFAAASTAMAKVGVPALALIAHDCLTTRCRHRHCRRLARAIGCGSAGLCFV